MILVVLFWALYSILVLPFLSIFPFRGIETEKKRFLHSLGADGTRGVGRVKF
jgi:hypothetical protein